MCECVRWCFMRPIFAPKTSPLSFLSFFFLFFFIFVFFFNWFFVFISGWAHEVHYAIKMSSELWWNWFFLLLPDWSKWLLVWIWFEMLSTRAFFFLLFLLLLLLLLLGVGWCCCWLFLVQVFGLDVHRRNGWGVHLVQIFQRLVQKVLNGC